MIQECDVSESVATKDKIVILIMLLAGTIRKVNGSRRIRGQDMSEARVVSGFVSNQVIQTSNGGHHLQSAANEYHAEQTVRRTSMVSMILQAPVAYFLVLVCVYLGWNYNSYLYLTPEHGLGYALGIIGASLMLMLLLYPLRKHARWARGLGPVRYWFRSHMLMGIAGPVCILFHCNYQLGSANGNIALFSMLLVAGSGLVGRHFYTKIHYGLYGSKADLVHLGSDAARARVELEPVFDMLPGMKTRLQRLEEKALSTQCGFITCLANVLLVNIRSRWYGFISIPELRRNLYSTCRPEGMTREQRRCYYQNTRHYLSEYLSTVRKVVGFSFYERLFSMWHVFHLPIFIMLLITGIIHVYAVHMY